jgi:quercetin dioxygenase-like cupin family protein
MKEQESHMQPVVRQRDEAERRWFSGGGIHLWHVSTSDTNGSVWLMEDVLTKGKTTPLHQHDTADELIYVLEGELLLSVNGDERALSAGGIALVPRGVPHALLVTSDTCRVLVWGNSPSGEAFFRAASDTASSADATGPVDFQRVIAAGAETGGMRMLGPPPFVKR